MLEVPSVWEPFSSKNPKNGVEKVLHEFNGDDGERPTVALLSSAGALYGVTPIGGTRFAGTIFKIDPANGNETTLYNFGNDAFAPDGSLIMWKDALYGTTRRGGQVGKDVGTIFRYTPGTNKFDELYAFGGKPDGAHPRGGLLFLNVDRQDQILRHHVRRRQRRPRNHLQHDSIESPCLETIRDGRDSNPRSAIPAAPVRYRKVLLLRLFPSHWFSNRALRS